MSLSTEFDPVYLRFEQRGPTTVVRIMVPRLTDEVNLEQLGHELFTLVDQWNCHRLVVSLDVVEYMTSSGVGKLITLHRRVGRVHGQVVFCSLHPVVTEILETSRLNTYFQIAPDLESALAMIHKPEE